jgi:hypothetical protein
MSTALFSLIVSPAFALIGAIVGALLGHRLTRERDREQRRRELVLTYLIDAWKNLETGSRDNVDIHRKSEALEKAIADIQLFGSPEQIGMASEFAKSMTANSSANTTPLLSDLRDSLRLELNLKKAPTLFFFRLTPRVPKSSSIEPK